MWLRRAAISGGSSSQRPNAAESGPKPRASGCGAVTVICVSFRVQFVLRVLGGPCRAPAGPLFLSLGPFSGLPGRPLPSPRRRVDRGEGAEGGAQCPRELPLCREQDKIGRAHV